MPITPTYPGVYIEEVPSGVHTITGVATSIAAFFGRTARGPLNKAVRILSLSDFKRTFGGAHPESGLAQSVRQFLENGGTDCYVIRIAHGAEKAELSLQNLAGDDVLIARAKYAGSWGNHLYIEVDYNTMNPDETFNMRVIHRENDTVIAAEEFTNLSMNPNAPRFARSFVNQSSQLVDLELGPGFSDAEPSLTQGYSESRRPFDTTAPDFPDLLNDLVHPVPPTEPRSQFYISVNNSPPHLINLRENSGWTEFTVTVDHTDVSAEITQRINDQLPDGLNVTCDWIPVHDSFYVLRISSAEVGGLTDPNSSVRIQNSTTNDFAGPMMLGLHSGGIEVAGFSNHRPAPTGTMLAGDISNINGLAQLQQNAFNQITINSINIPLTDLATTGDLEPWYRDGLTFSINEHNDGIREKLNIIAQTINTTPPPVGYPSLPFRAEVWGYHLAILPTSGTSSNSLTITTGNEAGGGRNIGAGGDGWFNNNVRQYALSSVTPGRDDDGNPLLASDYIGSESDQTGFYALDSVDIFNLMVIPPDIQIDEDKYMQITGQASIYCQQHRAFLLLDAPPSWTSRDGRPQATKLDVDRLRSLVVNDHTAVFYPRVQYLDREGIKHYTGPSGAIAGLMARIDSTRGVWKAPAGIEADLRGLLDLEVTLTDRESGVFNPLGVNCLRKFPGGMVNWGARTLAGSDELTSEWKYIPVRRLALFLEESLYRGTKWVVFEPNDEPLWAQIRLNLNAFMMSLFRRGAFQGSTPDQAFFVKCDGETTTQDDRNRGIVNIEVGFAPLKPAEFVIIRIQQIAGQLG